ncbi:SH3 domain-containing protein [Halobacillus andaensis]|nr:SH3 domain-containing protein [Halobacillus andaensis]MBP2005382.1 beta-N-acetylglucosaminidase/uncharacterized protein YraI [Halobacillus andaensis]
MQASFLKAVFSIVIFTSLLFLTNIVLADEEQTGIALKNPTSVYNETDKNSPSLKQYEEGKLLKFKEHNNNWYKATVYLNHQAHIGYIHKDDIEETTDHQESLQGRANEKVTVYDTAATSSPNLKSYNEGSILKYKSFSENWYEATVYVNYEAKTGYIHKKQVETAANSQDNLTGIAEKSSTNVYSTASSHSNILKSYSNGTILKYKTYLNDWYEATVYVDGEKVTGYIHKEDVETGERDGEELSGIGLLKSTNVYSDASTDSRILKSYPTGSNLRFREYSSDWYIAQVYINGEKETGYIHKDHVEKEAENNDELQGIGLKNPTSVYEAASTNSTPLKSYGKGSILKYNNFSENWYEATVYLNGEAETGYIHKEHVENKKGETESVNGLAATDQSKLYELASTDSPSIKSFEKNDVLKLETFSNNWYKVQSYQNEVEISGYMHADDISLEDVAYENTTYDVDFYETLEQQAATNPPPKSDGSGVNDASKEEIEYYLNPNNFSEESDSFFQFLVLSQPAGLNADNINKDVLFNAGTLTDTAESFVEAGQKYNVNEAYLISHALHETNYGASELAEGVPVDEEGEIVNESEAEQTVYNMYGIGAVDAAPVSGGAKTAFDNEWFTPEEAIVGGAKFAADQYVNRGQNTLYKMKWNPDSPTWNQYATHVAWADIQTKTISDIYETTENYVLTFDVPSYEDQPSPIDKPEPSDPEGSYLEYPEGIKGTVVVNDTDLNFREGPSEDEDTIQTLSNETVVDLKGTDGEWLEIVHHDETGWVHSDYIKHLNLLEVTTDSLNVRSGPSIQDEPVGSISREELIAGKLDEENKLITEDEWYQIIFNGEEAWASSGKDNDFIVEN